MAHSDHLQYSLFNKIALRPKVNLLFATRNNFGQILNAVLATNATTPSIQIERLQQLH